MANQSFKTTFKWNAIAIAELTSINGLEITVDSIDTTTHSSADGFRTFLPGMAAAGDVSIEGYFAKTDTTGQHAMVTDAIARTSRAALIEFNTSPVAKWSFSGFITSIKIGDADLEGNIKFSATIKPTGKPVFTP